MQYLRLKTLQFVCFSIAALASTTAYTCEFHGGFGGNPYMHYGAGSDSVPPMLRRPQPADTYIETSTIKLSSPTMINATRDKKIEIPIDYSLASSKEDTFIQLELNNSPEISVEDNNSVVLDEKSGLHVFTIVPKVKGTYRMMLTARALNQSGIPARRKTIYVKVIE